MNRTLKRIKIELRRRMHDDVMETGRWLGRVLRGWLNYYAVPTSYRYLHRFVWRLRGIWTKILRRRCCRPAAVSKPCQAGLPQRAWH